MTASTVLRVTDQEHNAIKKILVEQSDEDIQQSLQTLKDWLKKEPHLPDTDDEQFILTLLMFSKCNIEVTKKKLDGCYTYKSFMSDHFTNYEPLQPGMQKFMDNIHFVPLPKLTEDYIRVLMLEIQPNGTDFDLEDFLKYTLAVAEIRFKYDITFHDHIIVNLTNCSLSHVMKISPNLVIKYIQFLKKIFPNRMKGIHFLNVPSYAIKLIQLLKSLLKTKIAERVHIHADLTSVHKHISTDVLPVEYGGTEKSINEIYKEWRDFLESQNDWIKERSNIKSNEKLRIGELHNFDNYGPEGSFRQLNVD